MPQLFKPLLAALTLASLAACASPAATSGGLIANNAGGVVSNGLGSLIAQNTVSPEEQALRDTLVRPNAVTFPTRLGILFYHYDSNLKLEDQQALMAQVRSELQATGLVKTAFQLPQALVGNNASLADLRTLAARFQVDVLLLLSGSGDVVTDDPLTSSFWDQFANKGWYAGRATVEGLALDVATGIFLSSFNAAGASDATQVDLNSGFDAATYPLDLKAETTALEGAKQKLVDAFNGLKAANGAH